MPMKNPPHPGGAVLRDCIEPLGLSITDTQRSLGFPALRYQSW
jgi:plasmid maintenance system antidote protein VapI